MTQIEISVKLISIIAQYFQSMYVIKIKLSFQVENKTPTITINFIVNLVQIFNIKIYNYLNINFGVVHCHGKKTYKVRD